MSVLVTYRTPPVIQLSARSYWSHILGGRAHLDSSPSPFCRPAWEGLVVKHTELWTCVSCLLVDTGQSIIVMAECSKSTDGILAKLATTRGLTAGKRRGYFYMWAKNNGNVGSYTLRLG